MKNKNLFIAIIAAGAIATACNNNADSEVSTTEAQEVAAVEEAASFAVNTSNAQITWIGFKTNVDWKHNGVIKVSNGNFEVKDGAVVGGSFTIDMNTIEALDIPKEDENYPKLVGHLASPDFFDVANHPTSTFEITSVTSEANAEAGTNVVVSGNLTMRGQTNNITFPANISVEGDKVTFTAPEFTINRTKWGVEYASTNIADLAKDKLIDDYIKLTVDLTATK